MLLVGQWMENEHCLLPYYPILGAGVWENDWWDVPGRDCTPCTAQNGQGGKHIWRRCAPEVVTAIHLDVTTPPCLITFLICYSVGSDASSSVSWHAQTVRVLFVNEIHEKCIWVLINGCRTPEMSKMHADESSDLRVVAKILRDVFGVSHHVKLATSLQMVNFHLFRQYLSLSRALINAK